jgi:antibiotic biosynthesis monooxygenase (ABM) superfamily enzyme
MALLAWPIAFGLVLTLLTIFKQQLASMALAPRALLISAVLVSVMAIVVMPLLTVAVSRALAEEQGAGSGTSPVCAPRAGPTVGA